MTTKTLSKSELAQFTGSDNWYRHTINRNVLYTDGAQHVAEHGGAYWLLDEIAIIQPYNKRVAAGLLRCRYLLHTNWLKDFAQ